MSAQPADWQPIDTAPKDGTQILLHFPGEGEGEVRIGAWTDRQLIEHGVVTKSETGWKMADRAEIRPPDDPAAWAPCEPPPAGRFRALRAELP
jgi:hypothetical protein